MSPVPAVSPLPLDAVFDHVAMAAPRIRDLLPIYRDLLGGDFHDGGDNVRVGYRAVQLRYPGGGKIELLEPLAGSTFLDSFLRRNPRGGVHHVTFTVTRSLEEVVTVLQAHGYRPHGASVANPDWHEVFLHPREASGVLVQIARPGPGYGPEPGRTLDDVLAGKTANGNGVPSP